MPLKKHDLHISVQTGTVLGLAKDIGQLLKLPKGTWYHDEKAFVVQDSLDGWRSFLHELPSFCKSFETELDRERKERSFTAPPSPLCRVVLDLFKNQDDYDTGYAALIVRCLRQYCYIFYKMEKPYEPAIVDSVIDGWKRTEESLRDLTVDSNPSFDASVRLSRWIWKDFDPSDIKPGHGPGAVATGERDNGKWDFSVWYNQLRDYYPCDTYHPCGLIVESHEEYGFRYPYADLNPAYFDLPHLDLSITKVVLVPKDSRGPRLISEEPLVMQFLQQGLARKMMAFIESHRRISGSIRFLDQSINQDLACEGSVTGLYSTIDLKDASDRITRSLVKYLFPENLANHLLALSSTHTTLPNGDQYELFKFAPMGSALCFPVLSFVCWALIEPIRSKKCPKLKVAVFGDDLIVPTSIYSEVRLALEDAGLKINESKSFSKARGLLFRESCGTDWLSGHLVTPIRIKKNPPVNASSPSELLAWRDYESAFRKAGYLNAANAVEVHLTSICGPLARFAYDMGFFHLYGKRDLSRLRFSKKGHRTYVWNVLKFYNRTRKSPISCSASRAYVAIFWRHDRDPEDISTGVTEIRRVRYFNVSFFISV